MVFIYTIKEDGNNENIILCMMKDLKDCRSNRNMQHTKGARMSGILFSLLIPIFSLLETLFLQQPQTNQNSFAGCSNMAMTTSCETISWWFLHKFLNEK